MRNIGQISCVTEDIGISDLIPAKHPGCNLSYLIAVILFFQFFCSATATSAEKPDKTEQKLYQLAAEGILSDELVSSFYAYAFKKAKEKIQAPQEFWNWLAEHKEIQYGLLVGLHPEYNPHVIKYLQELRKTYGSEVERYPHLALSFSFVYGAAKGQTIRDPWLDWVARNRDVPSCCESFAYYIENKDKMLYPLDHFSWPLLLYVADNDVPISERQWVLNRYEGRGLEDIDRLHNEPQYVKGAYAREVAAMEGSSMALPRIMSDGGVCSQLAYYASRTLKCLGVPSVRLLERNHAFEGWVAASPKLEVKIGAAYDNRQNGRFLCPLTRNKCYEYEFKMLAASIALSYERYLQSRIASHVFSLLPDDLKKEAAGLLDASIKTNPHVIESWLEYARACRENILSFESGWILIDRAKLLLPDRPELACAILNILTAAQLKNDGAISDAQCKETADRFKEILVRLHKQNRMDLAPDILKTQADYLARTQGIASVVDHSVAWFKLDGFSMYYQRELFQHVHEIILTSKEDGLIEKFLKTEYQRRKLLVHQSSKEMQEECYTFFVQAARAYISYYEKNMNKIRAAEIALELDKLKDENVKLYNLRDVITQGRPLGTIEEQITKNIPTAPGCYVWRILYDLPGGLKIRIRVKHSAAGNAGAFCLTAWSDKDDNGVPDNQIGISPLLTADKKDQWSQWEFEPTDKTVFVGIVMKEKMTFYYQMGGELAGYYGLSDRVFYSREIGQTPENSVQPRYINIQVEILRTE